MFDKSRHDLRDVTQAMRSAICDQIFTYKNLNVLHGSATCKLCLLACGSGTDRVIHVDHATIPFNHILEQFCVRNVIELSKIELGSNYLIKDGELMMKWKSHHEEMATYQILCRSCNTAKGCKV